MAKRNLLWALVLLVVAVLGCRNLGKEAVRTAERDAGKTVQKEGARAIEKVILDAASKRRIAASIKQAAADADSEAAAKEAVGKRFDDLVRQDRSFGNYVREKGKDKAKDLSDCFKQQALHYAVPDLVKECFHDDN